VIVLVSLVSPRPSPQVQQHVEHLVEHVRYPDIKKL